MFRTSTHLLLLLSLLISSTTSADYCELIEEWDPYKTAAYINCHHKDVPFLLFSPNGQLTSSEIAELTPKLQTLLDKGINTFFVIVQAFEGEFAGSRIGHSLFINEFRYYLLKGNANIQEENLLIIIYAIDDARSGFLPGEKVAKVLSANEYNKIQTRQLSKIRDENFYEAFQQVLDDTITFVDKCDDCVTFWIGIGFFIIAGTISLILLLIQFVICLRGKQLNSHEKEVVGKMSKFLDQYSRKREALDEHCIICLMKLEDGNGDKKALEEGKDLSKEHCKKLNCGHHYHHKCFEEWTIKEDDTCAMCVEKMEKDCEVEKMMRKLVDVQSKLYPVFNELVFTRNDNKLKYKFSNDFHSGDLTQLN